jgi:hypothetical protein
VNAGSLNRSIDCYLKRDALGVRVHVKVSEEVEEFFKQWGGGIVEAPTSGRLWKQTKGSTDPIRLWSFDARLPHMDEMNFILTSTGTPLIDPNNGHTNLSFLRLVGASAPEGREFVIESVISRSELDRIATKICKASESFYMNFIQPVNINVYVGVMDVTRAGL